MIRSIPILALTLAACQVAPAQDAGAPGGWFWFKTATAAEREAYYTTQCRAAASERACVDSRLRLQAVQTCRIEERPKILEEDESLLERLRDREACADALLLPHGIDVDLT